MHQYELMVILDPDIDEKTVAPSLDKFLNVVRKDGGTIENVDFWGKRRLAYQINKKGEGIYAVVKFTALPETTNELDRQLRLSEAVMRTKVLRAEEAVAEAESASDSTLEEPVADKAQEAQATSEVSEEAPAKAAVKAAPAKAAPAKTTPAKAASQKPAESKKTAAEDV